MKKIIFLFVMMVTYLLANANPKIYAALGDVIYNNVASIEKLKEMAYYDKEQTNIEVYVRKVLELKEQGFSIESGNKSIDTQEYLNKLRLLSKTNDYYKRSARACFKHAMNTQDSITFTQIINTGLIDTTRNKDLIINYYLLHKNEINPEGVIQTYLDHDAKLMAQRAAKKRQYKSKKELEAEKIKRIRKNDKEKQIALEKRLDQEVLRKKKAIIKEQKSELFN